MADRQSPAQPRRHAIALSLSSPGRTGAEWDSLVDGGWPNSSVEGLASAHDSAVPMLLRG